MSAPAILTSVGGGVLRVTLNEPDRRNPLSGPMVAALTEAVRGAPAAGVRSVLLTGAGPAFCAGMDLRERSGGGSASGRPFMELVDAIRCGPVPVVARVNGAARAGGLVLAAACDIAIADAAATFAMPETRIGLTAEITLAVLSRRAPAMPLRRYALTGEVFDSPTARELGVISQVSAPGHLDTDVESLLADLGRCSPDALAATKRRLTRDLPSLDELLAAADASDAGFTTPHAREGLASAQRKQPPPWAHPRG